MMEENEENVAILEAKIQLQTKEALKGYYLKVLGETKQQVAWGGGLLWVFRCHLGFVEFYALIVNKGFMIIFEVIFFLF